MINDTPILIVEDEPKLASLMRDYLIADGYTTQCLDNGLEVLPAVRAREPRLVLLELMCRGAMVWKFARNYAVSAPYRSS